MSHTWKSDEPPLTIPTSPLNWVLIVLRGVPILILFLTLSLLLVLGRLIEAPLFGLKRPVTPYLTQGTAYLTFLLLGMRFRTRGTPMRQHGAVVANHASWMDIITLSARQQIFFVAKTEVADWPGIGWLARATGTLFIMRDRREAAAQKLMFESRLKTGHKLLFFPEGTSTDSQRVLEFKPTLFAAFFDEALKDDIWVQPVSVMYTAPKGQDPRFYGWWGGMNFGQHVLKVLGAWPQGGVEVVYHPPLAVRDFADRKAIAKVAEHMVRDPVTANLGK
ncbi:1-acyl-sn-glycerol-3-phosphate acyltransferase [Pseudoruegeria sp. SK021]|uniref:lysophospholipid acyltransferase family protein n=1 Tax=Pseudoruegeria sp. SK021 TaxID=1933035 RepID=UPI000A2542E3|nr:lysophospholipid acyltransferase family protein [Pseudoruegeria sp. SK021]OSP56365.1 1-acyl-sn-glycerol-3-phosphate acyltransferase [Pseudoruegeria sp. SK021]